MAKKKRKKSTKWETTIYKTIHVKLKIELHNRVRVKTPLKPGVNSGAPEA